MFNLHQQAKQAPFHRHGNIDNENTCGPTLHNWSIYETSYRVKKQKIYE